MKDLTEEIEENNILIKKLKSKKPQTNRNYNSYVNFFTVKGLN
jgi:hypothetical protein